MHSVAGAVRKEGSAMEHSLDLEALERKAYLSYADDGLIELFLGLAILVFGLGFLIGEPTIGIIIPICLGSVGPLVKTALTRKRLGFV